MDNFTSPHKPSLFCDHEWTHSVIKEFAGQTMIPYSKRYWIHLSRRSRRHEKLIKPYPTEVELATCSLTDWRAIWLILASVYWLNHCCFNSYTTVQTTDAPNLPRLTHNFQLVLFYFLHYIILEAFNSKYEKGKREKYIRTFRVICVVSFPYFFVININTEIYKQIHSHVLISFLF